MYVHAWIVDELSTTFCAAQNMVQLIPWKKLNAVAKHLFKKQSRLNPQKNIQAHLSSVYVSTY